MNLTELWYQIVDMSHSDKVFATVAGFALSESQVLWLAGIILLIVIVLLVRAIVGWLIGNSSPRNAKNRGVVFVNRSTTEKSPVEQQQSSPEKNETGPETPHDLLADTSERKRSLYDYVTPDAIHADVMKQTLNNDFPYVTLKPNPNLVAVGQKQPEPAQSNITQPGTITPPKLENISQIIEQENEPVLVSKGSLPTTPLATQAQPAMPTILQQPPQQNTTGVPVLQSQTLPTTPTPLPAQPTVNEEKPLTAVEFAKMPTAQTNPEEQSTPTVNPVQSIPPTNTSLPTVVLPPLPVELNQPLPTQSKIGEQQPTPMPVPAPITVAQPSINSTPQQSQPIPATLPVQVTPNASSVPLSPVQQPLNTTETTSQSTSVTTVQTTLQPAQPISQPPATVKNSVPFSPTNPLLP